MFAHIPFGYRDILTLYSRHMNVLIDRFEGIIEGLFFGHLHLDNFQVNRGIFSNEPTKVQ